MTYPYNLYGRNLDIRPIFDLDGPPFMLDLSGASPYLAAADARDQREMQRRIEADMRGRHSWGLSPYLENREVLLSSCPQMVREGRFYHLGLDIIAPLHAELRAPLDAVVEEAGYEPGDGDYGCYVVLKHQIDGTDPFYSLYGHLERASLPREGVRLPAGTVFSRIGDFHENGNWFHHTHLQILTEEGFRNGFVHKGYCAADTLRTIPGLCPDPLPLFRV